MMGLVRFVTRVCAIVGAVAFLACGDASGPDGDPVFQLELRNVIRSPLVAPDYLPEFTVAAVNAAAREIATRPGALDEVSVQWPDGTITTLKDNFEMNGGIVLVDTVPEERRPLPTGTYELLVRWDDSNSETFPLKHTLEALDPPQEVVVIGEQDQATVRWVGPPQTHRFEAILFRIVPQPGPDQQIRVRSLISGGASGGTENSVVVPFEELPEGEGGQVHLLFTNDANSMLAIVTVKVAEPAG